VPQKLAGCAVAEKGQIKLAHVLEEVSQHLIISGCNNGSDCSQFVAASQLSKYHKSYHTGSILLHATVHHALQSGPLMTRTHHRVQFQGLTNMLDKVISPSVRLYTMCACLHADAVSNMHLDSQRLQINASDEELVT